MLIPTNWYVDGVYVGTADAQTNSLSMFLGLGERNIKARTLIMTGVSTVEAREAFYTVNVIDTTAPSVGIEVYDQATGQMVTEVPMGDYQIILSVDDACDPHPVAEGVAMPVYAFESGDTLRIDSSSASLPVSGVNFTATATDESGNSASISRVLNRGN